MMRSERVHIIQGQFEVRRNEPDCCLTTVLGSCISVCLLDPFAKAGGMNYFLLAQGRAGGVNSASYGVNAMELLINGLLKVGAERPRLRAHVFGGARMLSGLSNVGQGNSDFAMSFLRAEGIRILSQSTGGTQARRINFWPCSGLVKEELVREIVAEKPEPTSSSGSVELF